MLSRITLTITQNLPSVASGDRLAFLDPHEMYFGKKETGQQYDLQEPLLSHYFDQFSPFEDVLGYKVSDRFVNGTMFRFPLRNEPSKLSQKLYSPDKVRNLFQSLKEEASLILLFLKNIEEINLYETDDEESEKLVFSVRLDKECRVLVRQQRQLLLQQVPKWRSKKQPVLKLTLQMIINIFDSSTGTRTERWLTHNQIGDKSSKTLQRALELHLLPWVGFAAPLTVQDVNKIGNNGGRIFCFLPLPPDADSRTGYPVHIHGYFGLTDNRRGLKWPGPECQNDDMAEWNVDLMKYVGTEAYANLLVAMTTHLQATTPSAMINTFYRCWPDKQFVIKHWKGIFDALLKRLLRENVFWTPSKSGQWLSVEEVVFHQETRKLPNVVTKMLSLADEPVVFLPPHVYDCLPSEIRTVKPSYCRSLLKKNHQASWDINRMTRQEKISMLEYITTDKKFVALDGIALLPLANNKFGTFKAGKNCRQNDVVFVEHQFNRMSLLPGMEHRFLDPKIPPNLLMSLSGQAVPMNNIHHSALQLVRLEPMTIVHLLKNVLPGDLLFFDRVVWHPSQGGHPSEQWLVDVWTWLHQTFSHDLSHLEGYPLIECSSDQGKVLIKLNSNPTTIKLHNEKGESLPSGVTSVLSQAGVNVLSKPPHYMAKHPCFTEYVADASPEGVLTVLKNVGLRRCAAVIVSSTAQEKRSLREFLSHLRTRLSKDNHVFLKSLPIYEAMDGSSFISAQNKSYTAPRDLANNIPIKLLIHNASTILSVEDKSSKELLSNILEVPSLTTAMFLTQEVFPYLPSYTHQQVTTLMCWVLRRINVFQSEKRDFHNILYDLKFVDTGEEELSRPRDLFDPKNSLNQRLYEAEKGKFPVGEFAMEDILVQLRALQMKSTPDQDDVVTLIEGFENFTFGAKNSKALALLELLDKYASLLERNVEAHPSTTLRRYLHCREWVPCKINRPVEYPKCMPWKSVRNRLLKPQEVVAPQHAPTVGAVMAVLQFELSDEIQEAFNWDDAPDVSYVAKQLRIACTDVKVQSLERKEKERFWRMLKQIYQVLACNPQQWFDFPWIWNGNGFSYPDKIAFHRGTTFDLEPYLHTVPDEMEELFDFFKRSGVASSFSDANLLGVLQDVKDKHELEEVNRNDVSKDRELALNILHWLVRADHQLDPKMHQDVYVPVMDDPSVLKLVPLVECTFCDADWLRGNFVELQNFPELCQLSLIDESISNATASRLGVPPMSRCVTAPEILGFEQAGPYEPVTTRLKNILDEYKEGAGVFKELIQNADDAGATEVKFLVDWRHHPDQKVLTEGMKETQGPALLAYNNAVFTEDDFQNINKLAGATKKEDLEKIGRFGLGFNSVYHFTDTPSFLSSKDAVFFDPDTKHLRHFISSPSHPGIKINLAQNRQTLLCYPDQFQPYHGVFSCNTQGDQPFHYNGTLFRFPFRRCTSEISDKQYKKQDVDALLQSFYTSASSLLLNTQKVCHVSVWELDEQQTNPNNMKLLIKVDKTVNPQSKTTFLHECAEWSKDTSKQVPQRVNIVSTTVEKPHSQEPRKAELWLQCDRMGTGESFRLASSDEGKQKGLLSCAGVAIKLKSDTIPRPMFEMKAVNGEAFCFLPLSIPTGLPVHVNGYLAVTSNRRAIWESTSEDGPFQPIEVRWNQTLMKDAIAHAYLDVLAHIQDLDQNGGVHQYEFYSLWPNPDRLLSHAWLPLVTGVYSSIASSSRPLVKSGDKWYTVKECIYPDEELRRIPGSLEILHQLGYKIVNLPPFARKGFELAGCEKQVQRQTMSQKRFLEEIFFPNIGKIEVNLCDKVVCYVIDKCLVNASGIKETFYQNLLRSYCCIPCSSNQRLIKKPQDLVHPFGDAASLYSQGDNMVPVGKMFLEPKRLLILEKLGMNKDNLSWDQVIERAKSIDNLTYSQGLQRVSNLIKFLNNHITTMADADISTRRTLASLPILPVMSKPDSWFCPWSGEAYHATFLSASDLYDRRFTNMVGSFKPILDESGGKGCGQLTSQVKKLFQIECRSLQVEDVVEQLEILRRTFQSYDDATPVHATTAEICNGIYAFFQKQIDDEETADTIRHHLQDSCLLFVESRFLRSRQLAFEWDVYSKPYLYQVPGSLYRYRRFLELVGVKKNFSTDDILSALKHMKTEKEDKSLNKAEFNAAKKFIDKLHELGAQDEKTPLPDQDRILRPAEDLVINDAPWVKVTRNVKYVHKDISINVAHRFGAQDVRSKSLAGISRTIGEPFGQKELLTDRLAGILKSYPCDFGILKELLQNADDAKATEIHFIYDPRKHEGPRVFSDSWHELQGPALCVFNSRPFSEQDIEGIQRLGIGSKGDSPEKTGQYGIGFNSVYHLTDCPSFITNGDTLCILDPHARYAPGATEENPGRLIGPIDGDTYENYQDVFPGYLGDMFQLKDSTMFRFPLRNAEMASKSKIANKDVHTIIEDLLERFQMEAKETLLFLNYVKKISISKIEDGKLRPQYEVSSDLNTKDERARQNLSNYVRETRHRHTNEIAQRGVFYPITLKDSWFEEKWLIQQTIGVLPEKEQVLNDVPDGKPYGLLPRAGVAVKVSRRPLTDVTLSEFPIKAKAFCFLPLPVTTKLPVHVNGHFALDSGRRHLWHDEDKTAFKTKWNHFIKTKVLADAYVHLLIGARQHIPSLQRQGSEFYFTHSYIASSGLRWYEGLFPSQSSCESQWKEVVDAVLNKIVVDDQVVIPIVQSRKIDEESKHFCTWQSPSECYFPDELSYNQFLQIVRNIGFQLASFTNQTYKNFIRAKTSVKEMTSDSIMMFLSRHEPLLKQLPCPIETSSIESVDNLLQLLTYCMKSPGFVTSLQGVPLLYTRDGYLRVFSGKNPVYLSTFSHLVQCSEHYKEFVNEQVVDALSDVYNDLFEQNPPVVKAMTVPDLAEFLPFNFQELKIWSQTRKPVRWDSSDKDRNLRKWLMQLWLFLANSHQSNPKESSLDPLSSWPVVPTKDGHLFPVSLSKTVLNLRSSESWSPNQNKVVQALRDLRCPEADIDLMETRRADVSNVVKTYLAYPNSVSDIVQVLGFLTIQESDISGRIDSDAAALLLDFLQEDSETLQSSKKHLPILRKLPFYKTIEGRLISLNEASSVCKTPPGIPLEESDLWMEDTSNVFLEPCQKLDLLHQLLGVKIVAHTSCYIDFIFPKFDQFTEATRMLHLEYIRRNLLNGDKEDVQRMEKQLGLLKFIPDVSSGRLRRASDYYDPRNPVFKAMLSKDKFPGKPFKETEWLEFLCRIGLRTTFTKAEFLIFAKEVEVMAEREVTNAVAKRSQVLTNYLLQEESLHDPTILSEVSAIKFVVAHKADQTLTALVDQHLFEGRATPPCISFRSALSSNHERLVWASAALLPEWAWPKDEKMRSSLGVLEEPTPDLVFVQTQKICRKFDSKDRDSGKRICDLLKEVMADIYRFLQARMNMWHSFVETRFRTLPLILVEDGRVFVCCNQVAFEMSKYEEQPPYLYKVPREFGEFERLFKALGAVEKPVPKQYAWILQHIWQKSKGKKLHHEEMRHVKDAVRGLFRTLKALHKNDEKAKTTICSSSLQDVKTLYLPNTKEELKPSKSLFYASIRLLSRVNAAEFKYDLIYDLGQMLSGFDMSAEELLALLPSHLKVVSLSNLLAEDLNPDCVQRMCQMDASNECSYGNRVRSLLSSSHLIDGILRILEHQNRSKVDDETERKITSLKSVFNVNCVETLETILKDETGEDVQGSKHPEDYFLKYEDGTAYIYIQHGAEHLFVNFSRELSLAVNRYIANAVSQENFTHFERIILLGLMDQMAQIPSALDSRDIERYVRKASNITSDQGYLGTEIPFELRYLLVQFEDFLFRPNEIVGYETNDDVENGQEKYIYARIIRETSAPNLGGREKKPKRDPTTGKRKIPNPLLRKYLIDIGKDEAIEVDVLDLYKLKRPEELDGSTNDSDISDCQDIVPSTSTGDGHASGGTATTSSHSSTMPCTWEKAVKDVDKALSNIMKLPKEQRKKAFRRLYLKWHPDKNPGMEELATKVVQYMQNEFERLMKGGTKTKTSTSHGGARDTDWTRFYDEMNRRARRERDCYDNYRRSRTSFPRGFPFGGNSYGGTGYGYQSRNSYQDHEQNDYEPPNPTTARVWLRQCRSDLESATYLFTAKNEGGFYWLICFQCNQVVEKALKGALYGVSGISQSQIQSHDLPSLAVSLRTLRRGPDLVHSAGKLWQYYLAARYPNRHSPQRPPKEVYTFQDAKEAYDIAKDVLNKVEEFIGIFRV